MDKKLIKECLNDIRDILSSDYYHTDLFYDRSEDVYIRGFCGYDEINESVGKIEKAINK